MNPFFSKEMADEHIGDLRRQAREGRVPADYHELAEEDGLTVRAATQRDSEAVRLLAALEGELLPSGPMLLAQVGDDVVAALPLEGGRPLADPFRPSAHYVELLQLRARQLHSAATSDHRSFLPRLRGVLRAA